jgi:PAS domain S-box-containing protein
MIQTRANPNRSVDLRQQAETRLQRQSAHLDITAPKEAERLLQELRVHQIELEMQNEELHRTQVELEASRARYFDLYDLAPVGYVTISDKGLILEANLTAATLLKVARGTLVRQPLGRFILPEDQNVYYRHCKQLFETGSSQVCELRMRRVDAAPFWARLEATAAQDADGAPLCRVVVSDFSEYKRAEEALRESQEELKLKNAELEHKEELKQKNAELERLNYTVSHNLKSPLVTIKGFLGCLDQDLARCDRERIEKDMHYIHSAADKMTRLLDELLEMSRVGRIVNPPVWVTFQTLVEEALGAVTGRVMERRVEVRLRNQSVTLYGDRSRLVEIWQNLVENAVKFTGDQASPWIEIGAEPHGRDTVFFVRDNGIGIDPRHQAKVFGLFEKLDPNREGTGLGLALVKRIVELYKGTIWLESQGFGQGACFRFTLPEAVKNPSDGEPA